VAAVEGGKAAVAVVTQEFEVLAQNMARNCGRSGLRICVLPYPLESKPEAEVAQIAREHLPALFAALGVTS
jgi:hypothetical protein